MNSNDDNKNMPSIQIPLPPSFPVPRVKPPVDTTTPWVPMPHPLPPSPWVSPPPTVKPLPPIPNPHSNCICGIDGPKVLMMVIPYGGVRCPAHPESLVRGTEIYCGVDQGVGGCTHSTSHTASVESAHDL